jgi:hypothetical protein
MKPSISSVMRASAAASMAPASMAISKPPKRARMRKASSLADAPAEGRSGQMARACASSACLRARPASSSPVPRPTQSANGRPVMQWVSSEAEAVLPMPISPKASTLQPAGGNLARQRQPRGSAPGRTRLRSWRRRRGNSPCRQRRLSNRAVPRACPKSWATPASATTSCMPAWPARALIAAPPARKFSTICQVTSCG